MVEAKPSTEKEIEELTKERETNYRILLGEEEEDKASMSEGDEGSQEEQKEDDGDYEMTHDPDAPEEQVNLIDAELIRLKDTFMLFMSEIPDKYEPERQQIAERLERCNQGKRMLQNILGGATTQEEDEDDQMEDEVSEQVSIATIVT